MARAARPLLIAEPLRYAGRSARQARWLLAALALALLVALLSAGSDAAPGSLIEITNAGVVEAMRHGSDYYTASLQAARSADAPSRLLLTFPLPTLAVLQAAMGQVAAALLLYALAMLTLFAWWKRLRSAIPRPPVRTVAIVLAAMGMVSALLGEFVAVHDLWAGLLLSLSLATRTPRHWITAAALGLMAAMIRETAALYLSLMLAVALLEGHRREAAGWAIAMAVFAAAVIVHLQAITAVMGALDDPQSGDWAGAAGFGFALHAIAASTALSLLPSGIAALLVALAIAGWSAWRSPLATRALATILAFVIVLTFWSGPGRAHWAFLIAPLVPIGLIFVPDALRDLARAALDRRRITVTRTAS